MKYALLIASLVLLSSCTTLIPNEIENGKLLGVMPMQYGRVSYQVSQRLRADREDVFRQARRWAAFNMYNPAQALTVSDNQLGDVITKGSLGSQRVKTKAGYVLLPMTEYAISIECNDRRYRITLTNFYQNSPVLPHAIEFRTSDTNKKRAIENARQLDEKIRVILEDIQTFIEAEIKN